MQSVGSYRRLKLVGAGVFSFCLISLLALPAFSRDSLVPQKGVDLEGAEYVGMETCGACHEDVVKSYRLESHYGTSLQEGEGIVGEACESCHGPGSLHVDGDGDKAKIVRHSPEKCFTCHTDVKGQFQLQYHHPVTEGQMSCTDCHDFHGSKPNEFNSVTDLERSSQKCFQCHKEYQGPFIFEHDPMRDGCQTCHEPHGGVYNKLLVADDNALCLRCHWEPNTNNAAGNIGGVPHGTGGGNYFIGAGEDCVDHHRSPHGSNIWRTFNR